MSSDQKLPKLFLVGLLDSCEVSRNVRQVVNGGTRFDGECWVDSYVVPPFVYTGNNDRRSPLRGKANKDFQTNKEEERNAKMCEENKEDKVGGEIAKQSDSQPLRIPNPNPNHPISCQSPHTYPIHPLRYFFIVIFLGGDLP